MSRSEVPSTPGYRGLLALVIFLGVLILISVGALIAAAMLRAGRPQAVDEAYRASIAAPGQRIESTEIDGDRILVRLSGPNGQELVVIDAGSGAVLGRIAIAAGP